MRCRGGRGTRSGIEAADVKAIDGGPIFAETGFPPGSTRSRVSGREMFSRVLQNGVCENAENRVKNSGPARN